MRLRATPGGSKVAVMTDALPELSVTYGDVSQAATTLEQAAVDLRNGALGDVPNGFWVYGDPLLGVCVRVVSDALGQRQTVLAGESDRVAADLRTSLSAYQAADAEAAQRLEGLGGRSHGGGGRMVAR